MRDSSPGAGRVVVLVLFTVLFVAAWRSDHAATGTSDVPLAHRVGVRRTESIVVTSAASIGQLLPARAAANLASLQPADRRSDWAVAGIEAALTAVGRFDSHPEMAQPGRSRGGLDLGDRLAFRWSHDADRPLEFGDEAALLGGSWDERREEGAAAAVPGTSLDVGGLWIIDEANAENLDATPRVLR